MSNACGHDHNFDGVSDDYKRRLWLVIGLNAAMFGVEIVAGSLAHSQALMADALDFLADTLTYGLSLYVIGMSLRRRANAALGKGISLSAMAAWVLGSTIWQVFILQVPAAPIMAGVAIAALAANAASVLLLIKYKDGDANVRSVWLCSRNDMIGNVVVVAAAAGVWGSGTAWPDLIVAGLMAGLFLSSSVRIIAHALRERAHAS
jgi:Co/Zn/Cd efflux system component